MQCVSFPLDTFSLQWCHSGNADCQARAGGFDPRRGGRHTPPAGRPTAHHRRSLAVINHTRREILQSLERLSELAPDVRFGQLIANLSYLAIGPTNEAIWDIEDEQLLEEIRQHVSELSQRQSSVAN